MTDDIKAKIAVEGTPDVVKLDKALTSINTSLEKQIKLLVKLKAENDKVYSDVTQKTKLTPKAALATLSSGGAKAALTNAAATSELKQFEAQLEQILTRKINRFARGLTDAIKAADLNKTLSLKKTQSFGLDTSLEGLKRERLVRQSNIAESELFIASQQGRFFKGQPQLLKNINTEKEAVDNLSRSIENLSRKQQLANRTANLKAQTADPAFQNAQRQNKVEGLLGDGGASLLKIQTGLAGNYLVLNSLFNLLNFGRNFVVELDKSFRDLQAITNTTDTEMVGLKQTLIETSEATKFTAVEVTQAATILGQAGFSTEQIRSSIKAVTLLATATGTTLAESADVASSTISVFNLRAEEMGHVANVLTGAINLSKLTMDKLALGIQYAGNAAFQSGATLEELVAVLGGLANAGIKSGSTLGTGLRQIIVELQDPSKKFKENMVKLGLTMTDIDVKSQGLIGVFENLRDAGFNSSMAFKSFETRAASAYVAIANNIDVANRLYESIGFSNAAAIANERQMQSLANVSSNLTSAFGTLIYKGSEPLVQSLVGLAKGLTTVIGAVNTLGPWIPLLGSGMAALGITIAGLKLTKLARGLLFGAEGFKAFTLASRPALVAFTAISAAIAAYGYLSGTMNDTKIKLDEATAAVAESEGAFASQQARIESVDEELNRLANRYNKLGQNNSALQAEVLMLQAKFGEFSDALASGTISTIDDLIAAMQEVRGEFTKLSAEQAEFVKNTNQLEFRALRNDLREKSKNSYEVRLSNVFDLFNPSQAPNTQVYSVLGGISKQNKSIANYAFDEVTATDKEINDYISFVKSNLSEVYKAIRILNQKSRGKSKAVQQDIDNSIKLLQDQVVELEKIRSSLAGMKTKDLEAKVAKVAATSIAANIDKTVENFKIKLSKQKELIDAEEDPMKKDALGKVLKGIQKDLDRYLALLVDRKSAIFKSLLSEVGSEDAVFQFTSSLKAEGESLSTDMETKVDEVEENTNNFLKEQEKFFDGVAEIQKSAYERLKSTVDQNLDGYDRQIKKMDFAIAEATDTRNGSLRGKYSDAEIAMFEDSRKPIENSRRNQRIANLQSLLPGADQSIASAEKYLSVAQSAYNSNTKSSEAVRDLTSAQKDLLSAQTERYNIEKEIAILQDEQVIANGELAIAHKSLGDQISYVLEKYMEQKQIQSDLGLNIQANIISTLDNAESAFSNFIEESVTGTKTLKQAFKDMAVSIIQDMLKIQAKQLASSLLGSLVSSIGGAFTKGATIYSGPAGPAAPALTSMTGGFVHKATGGGVLGRDSVNALLEPGEYVLRKQAVDQIGRQNLDTINALGTRTLSQPSVDTSAYKRSEPAITNVYVVAPTEKPSLSKNDVLVTISEDLLRGGTTKKLVKAIATGGM